VSLDARTGIPDPNFGAGGVVDLKLNDDQDLNLDTADIGLHSAPTIAKGVVIIGAAHTAGNTPKVKNNAKGYVRGFDVKTGKRLWIFHNIPRKGEFGYDTWLRPGSAEDAVRAAANHMYLLCTAGRFTEALGVAAAPIAARLGLQSPQAVTSVLLLAGLILVPAMIALFAARVSRALSSASINTRELLCRFSMCLVPLGAAMWAAHFLFHFDTGWTSGLVAFQRAAQDVGLRWFNASGIGSSPPLISADAMLVTQTLGLDTGLLLALYLGWRVARAYAPRARDALCLLAPWAGVATVLFGFGIWIFLQPMQMRGVVSPLP